MTREAEAAFKAWYAATPLKWRTLSTAFLAGHAAADTDATRKLARMVELAGVLKAEPRAQISLLYADYAEDIASRILAIVEE